MAPPPPVTPSDDAICISGAKYLSARNHARRKDCVSPPTPGNVQRRGLLQREQSTTEGTVNSHIRARAWVAGSLAAGDVTARPGGAEAIVTARCDQGVGHGCGTI